jgi:hypothetical protein
MAPTIRNLLEAVIGPVLIPGSRGTRALKVDPHAPAVTVMTDFRTAPLVTTQYDTSIDVALGQMKLSGARFAFVVGADGSLLGSVTSYDIQGEKPVQYMVSVGCSKDTCAWRDVQVENIMEPLASWKVIDHGRASRMSVAQVADLMAQGGQRYLVVVEPADGPGGARQVRGLFSAARLQLLAGIAQPAEALAIAA